MVRIVMLAMGCLVAVFIAASLLIDEGEVVVLLTTDEQKTHDTEVWVIDGAALLPSASAVNAVPEPDGTLYLRARSPDAAWLARLRARPDVGVIQEEGEVARYIARVVDDRAMRERLNHSMGLKYGLAERFWGLFDDCDASIAVRLEPSTRAAQVHSPDSNLESTTAASVQSVQ